MNNTRNHHTNFHTMFHAENCVLLSFQSFLYTRRCINDVLFIQGHFNKIQGLLGKIQGLFKDLSKFFNFQGLFKGLMLFQRLFKARANHAFSSDTAYDSVAYDLVKTRLSESEAEAEDPTNQKVPNRTL